jgi:hypothetical protein
LPMDQGEADLPDDVDALKQLIDEALRNAA